MRAGRIFRTSASRTGTPGLFTRNDCAACLSLSTANATWKPSRLNPADSAPAPAHRSIATGLVLRRAQLLIPLEQNETDTAELALRFKSPLAERLMQEASSPSRRMMRLASPIDFDPGVRAVLAA